MNNFLYYTGEPTKILGGLTMYAVMILIGVIIAVVLMVREGKRIGVKSDDIYFAMIIGLPIGIVGARLWFVLFNISLFPDFASILGFRNGRFEGLSGLGIQGGFILAFIFVIIYCRIKHISLLKMLDLMAPGMLIAQVFGRWGNFFNHELYGPIDRSGFVKSIPLIGDMMFIDGEYRHPTFLYESILNLIGFAIMLVLRRKFKKLRTGDLMAGYLVWYGSVRIFTESLRLQSGVSEPLMAGPIPVSILTSAIFIFAGLLFFVLKRVLPLINFKNYKREVPTYKEGNKFLFNLKKCYIISTNRIKYEMKNIPQDYYLDLLEDTKKHKFDGVIFDLDGTILDSKALIDESVIYAFKKIRPDYKLTEEEIDKFFGPTLYQSFSNYTDDKEELEEFVKAFREFNIPHHDEFVRPFPEVKSTMMKLKKMGIKIGVASSKKTNMVKQGLKVCDVLDLFDVVVGFEEGLNPKPAPDSILKAKEEMGAKNVIYVGDTLNDIVAAKAAGAYAVGVLYIKNPEVMLEAKPDNVIERLSDLIKMVEE